MAGVIVFTGGGTAGHVMPNLALLPFLRGHFDQFHYIGSEGGIEKSIIADYPFIRYHEIPTIKLIRSLSPQNFKIPFVLMRGKKRAKQLLKQIKPDIIFSKGGYVALPVALSAGNIPIICHESDMSIGLANKLSINKCAHVCTSFETTAKPLKNGIHTGAPIRNKLYDGKTLPLPFNKSLPILLVIGGSLGARAINECIKTSLSKLLEHFNLIHIAGKGNLFDTITTKESIIANSKENVMTNSKESGIRYGSKEHAFAENLKTNAPTSVIKESAIISQTPSIGKYYQYEFAANIEDFYHTADFVVSRGGAGCMFELMALNKPALIIPLPKGNSRGDQVENANYFYQRGCCHVLSQDKLCTDSLLSSLIALKNDNTIMSNIQKAGSIDGTKKIADLIIETAKNYRKQ